MSKIYLIVLVALSSILSIWMVHAQESVDPYSDVMKSRLEDGGFVLGDPEAGVKLIEFFRLSLRKLPKLRAHYRRFHRGLRSHWAGSVRISDISGDRSGIVRA